MQKSIKANLSLDKMRKFNLLTKNAAKLSGKLSELVEMFPERVQVQKTGRRTKKHMHDCPFRDRIEQGKKIFLINLFVMITCSIP